MTVSASTSATSNALKTASKTESVVVNLLTEVYVDKSENLREAHSYTEQAQEEMIANIEATGGLLKPLIVARIQLDPQTENKPYILVDGYRRALALLEMAQADERWAQNIKAEVTDAGETEAGTILVQLIANTNLDLNPMEKAIAIQRALDDKNCDLSQRDIARMLHLSDANISQLLKMLRFPKEIQTLVSSGKLSFSHARVILEKVPEDQWMTAATLGAGTAPNWSGMVYGDFVDKITEMYTPKSKDGDEEGAGTGDAAKTSSQKPSKMLRATEVSGSYLEFVKQRVSTANAVDKTFTAKDVEEARLDTISTIMLNKETTLSKAIEPFLKAQEQKEAAEKAAGEATKKEEAFYRKQVKRVEELFNAPLDPANPNQVRPTPAQCYATATKEVYSLNEEARKALGFTLPENFEEFTKKLAETNAVVLKERAEDKKKREEKKAADKAAADKAEAEKKAAEAAGGTPAADAAPAVEAAAK